jgi:hypothetical protein
VNRCLGSSKFVKTFKLITLESPFHKIMHLIRTTLLFCAAHIPFTISQITALPAGLSSFNWPPYFEPPVYRQDFGYGDDYPVLPRNIRRDQRPNHWRIEEIRAQSHGNITFMHFFLYRSIWIPCSGQPDFEPSMCWWQISNDPVQCDATYDTAGTWQTCQRYLNRVDGERTVSEEIKNG